jgi:hypothetical protein
MEAKGLKTEVDVSSINVDKAYPEFAQLVDRVAACFSVRRTEPYIIGMMKYIVQRWSL